MYCTCGALTVFIPILDPLSIVAVNDADQIVCSLVIVISQSRPTSDLVLASHVPHDETRALVLRCLVIEADGRDCGRHFARI